MVRKILRCLPRSWMPKVTAIEEAKNLNVLALEDILGSLMTHELSMQKKDDDEEKENKKKKIVALKSSQNEDSEDDDDDDNDEELAFLTRRFKKFLAGKKKFGGRPNKKFHHKGEASKIEEIICYECNKPGHYKSDCPLLKKKDLIKKKKKAMIATWDDSDESSLDEDTNEEVAQIALMALDDHEEEENDEVTYDELVLLVEKYSCMIASLKKKVKTLTYENDELNLAKEETSNEIEVDLLENEIAYLVKENKNLKEEIEALKKTFSKFSNSSEKLEKLLGMQRCVFDKAGLRFEQMNNVKLYQTFFDRKEKIEKEKAKIKKTMCDYCGKIRHTSFTCFHKKNAMFRKNLTRSCNFCGKYGHTHTQCYHKRNAMSKKNIMCTHCGRYGHAFSSCFHRRNNVVISCNTCGNHGHTPTSCFYKQNVLNDLNFSRTNRSWVPKGTNLTNPKGPKVCWVPQTKT
ncbi:zf-CCHC domain-containing protein/UBN2 domain-containing protein [Cephalotus follicularis]|uniref:Zf-CCHC domain-containing protein/UBN2 domain-containing protein n=1 Tax=Cephalotus follicularis TaxID=3775 RepID=A0A1Q3B948_CEPFO|nr:zf-CCHC domain-containing protein/UBN2 domain-containing protein [Cephalotus follicularis]